MLTREQRHHHGRRPERSQHRRPIGWVPRQQLDGGAGRGQLAEGRQPLIDGVCPRRATGPGRAAQCLDQQHHVAFGDRKILSTVHHPVCECTASCSAYAN